MGARARAELRELVLLHLERYGPDCRWMLARRLMGASGYHPSFDEGEIDSVCDELVSEGLVEVRSVAIKRGPTSSIKPWLKNRAREGKAKRPRCFLTVRGRRAAAAIRARLAAERHPRGPPRRENAGTSRPRRGIGVELWIDYPGTVHRFPSRRAPVPQQLRGSARRSALRRAPMIGARRT
jgi:hypothetical protein